MNFGRFMLKAGLCVAAALVAPLAFAETGLQEDTENNVRVERFSGKGRAFEPLKADPHEAQFRLGYLNNYHGHGFLDFVFGGDAALVWWDYDDGRKSSLTVRGLVAPRFEFASGSFDLQNTDFQGGLAFGTAREGLSWEAYVFHQSSHLGDEVLDDGLRERIDYSKEGLRFLASRSWEDFRLYGGTTVNFRTEPDDYDEYLVLQGGFQWRFAEDPQPMYVAFDIQSRQGNDWNPNATLQIGMELGDVEKVENRQRIFIEFFTGYSNMGQFYNESESHVLFGVAYNFR